MLLPQNTAIAYTTDIPNTTDTDTTVAAAAITTIIAAASSEGVHEGADRDDDEGEAGGCGWQLGVWDEAPLGERGGEQRGASHSHAEGDARRRQEVLIGEDAQGEPEGDD